jgi:polysaccharide export outer membrane protein
LGEVNRPGAYVFNKEVRLLEAISLAGGLMPNADLRKITIFRKGEGIITVDLHALLKLKKKEYNLSLKPKDTIYIPDNTENYVYVIGEVNIPGIYRIENTLTLLKAITLAGSPKDSASLKYTKLIRQNKEGPKIINIDLKKLTKNPEDLQEIILKPGDIIYLPPTKIAKFNKILDQIMPLFTALFYTTETTYNIREFNR